jgi:hypothetical protein
MASQGVQLTLEGGIVNREVTSGAAQFATDSLIWRRFIGLGAPLSTLFLQEPFTAAEGGPLLYADVVRETATYIALVRLHFPGMKLILQETYPFHSASALIDLIRDVNAAAGALGIAGLDGFELDHDWNARVWSVADVYRINEFVRAAGMTFSIILWHSGRQPATDCDFGVRTYNQYLYMYSPGYVQFGPAFAPDMWSVESWDPTPVAILPESGTCTFMQAVRDIVSLGM